VSADSAFFVEPLNPAKHRREEFDCGVTTLNDFIRTKARKEMDAGTSACFVLVPELDSGCIAGYYTLSAATVLSTQLPAAVTRKLPRYRELPATLLGRLARDVRFKGQHLGDRLMADALGRAVKAAGEVGSIAVLTDPKDDHARAFYSGYGFEQLATGRLFLEMKTAAQIRSL
jgi:predicted N-acetyltransferase YhbS